MNNHGCLVLNLDYSPIGIIDWKKSLIWWFKYSIREINNIEIIEYYTNQKIKTVNGYLKIPSVVRLTYYRTMKNRSVNFSRKNIFIRDKYTCQYCGKAKPISQLTYDHIIPKSKWSQQKSPTCWTNIVTACRKCNAKKSNMTLDQSGMTLIQPIRIPTYQNIEYLPITYRLHTIREHIPHEWLLYLPKKYYCHEKKCISN